MLQDLTTTVIGSIPAPLWDGIPLGPVKIHAYALCIILGAILAFWLSSRRWHARGGTEGTIFDISIWAVLFGLIGARLYHVFSSPDAYFGPGFDGTGDPIKILHIWNGGLGIWGAIGLGAVGAWIGCRRYGVRISAFADVVAPGILLAQAVGRLGNYFNQELFGAATDLPWGLQVDADHHNFPAGFPADTLFHPTFAYEMLWNILGVVLLLLIDRKLRLRRGMMLWSYVAWYTAGRTWIEMLRIDTAQDITLFGITQRFNVWTSMAMFVIAVIFLIILWVRRPRTAEEHVDAQSLWLPGRTPEEAQPTQATISPEDQGPIATDTTEVSERDSTDAENSNPAARE